MTMPTTTPWRPPLIWRAQLVIARGLAGLLCRLRVTGEVPSGLRRGPLILAVNHLSPFDPVVLVAACQVRRIAPRVMATGGLFRAPVVGPIMRASGHIRVNRRTETVADALVAAGAAIAAGSVVALYPEGRMGLDPAMWPERGKTGVARLAFASGATVAPVAIWGAHEVLPYSAPQGLVRGVWRAVTHRPTVRVHFGPPIDLDGLSAGRPGDARRATERIIAGMTAALRPLRVDEPDLPRYVDPTRPTETTRALPPPSG